MALVPVGNWNVTVSFKDNNDKIGVTGFRLPGNLLLSEAQGVATAVGNAMQAVSDAALIDLQLTYAFVNDAPPVPPATSEVERKLRIPLGTARFEDVTAIEVPSPAFTLEVNGTDVVDVTTPAVTALVDLLTEGSLGPANGLVTYFGEDITRAGTPFVMHRNRRKNS